MNGLGFGRSSVNVTASTGTSGSTNNPSGVTSPSSAMAPTPGYLANAALPSGASSATVARVAGSAGYVWKATTSASGGDKTDNPEIENRPGFSLNGLPHFSSISIDSLGFIGNDGKSGVIRINAVGTPGTAILLRGYEYQGDGQPSDLDDLKQHSILKWEMLIPGPFDLTDGDSGCNAIVIPFTITSDVEKLYFTTDGLAASSPNLPPVPTATVLARLTSGAILQLSATDDVTPQNKLKIYVTDQATPGFKAGPFNAGDKIFLRKNPNAAPSSRPLPSPYVAQVQTKGQALLIAEDDEGGVTNPGIPVP